MKQTRLMKKIKQPGYKKMVAVIFLAIVIYVGSATFPSTVENVAEFLTSEKHDFLATNEKIGHDYRGMLDFKEYNLRNKGFYINLNGLMARILGQRYVNERVKLDNGHLTYLVEERNITLATTQLTKLFEKQSEDGKAFLFVLAPYQIPKYENILPTGYKDYGNQNADDLLNALKDNGVPVLDLRDEMRNDGIDHTDAFFTTDHHWTPKTGFWAYTKIVKTLVNAGAIEPIDSMYTDISNYSIEIYNDFYLGTSGKRTGSYFAGVDDFTVITPMFETDISIKIPSRDIDARGEFSEIAYDKKRIKKNVFSSNPYSAYGHGDRGYKQYRNETAYVDLKVLAIGDSFSLVPFTFLPLVFSTYDQLDMRHYEGNFAEYYSEFDPDIVILLVNPSQIVRQNTTYDFVGDLSGKPEVSDEPEEE